ncbi:MAG: DUF5718 family protein [Planctomycetota bacterium]
MIDLMQAIGFGVAGNFAGHLEQAGEASDFINVKAKAGAPKGVFPFYVPPLKTSRADHFLHAFPLSTDTVFHPGDLQGLTANLQIEPELALLCELAYGPDQQVAAITPTHFAAYNDCSTRRPDATKISQKKNWGANTKGLASDQWIALDRFDDRGVLQHFRVACYLRRGGQLQAYGEDSPVAGPDGYGYMYRQLLDWLVDRFNTQQDHGPLENLSKWFDIAGQPTHAVISIGATRYTALGETTYLEPGDESIVVAYDTTQHEVEAIEAAFLAGRSIGGEGRTCSVLRQRVIGN